LASILASIFLGWFSFLPAVMPSFVSTSIMWRYVLTGVSNPTNSDTNCQVYGWLQTGFGLMIGFIVNLHT
jgi:hypothetical protein